MELFIVRSGTAYSLKNLTHGQAGMQAERDRPFVGTYVGRLSADLEMMGFNGGVFQHQGVCTSMKSVVNAL